MATNLDPAPSASAPDPAPRFLQSSRTRPPPRQFPQTESQLVAQIYRQRGLGEASAYVLRHIVAPSILPALSTLWQAMARRWAFLLVAGACAGIGWIITARWEAITTGLARRLYWGGELSGLNGAEIQNIWFVSAFAVIAALLLFCWLGTEETLQSEAAKILEELPYLEAARNIFGVPIHASGYVAKAARDDPRAIHAMRHALWIAALVERHKRGWQSVNEVGELLPIPEDAEHGFLIEEVEKDNGQIMRIYAHDFKLGISPLVNDDPQLRVSAVPSVLLGNILTTAPARLPININNKHWLGMWKEKLKTKPAKWLSSGVMTVAEKVERDDTRADGVAPLLQIDLKSVISKRKGSDNPHAPPSTQNGSAQFYWPDGAAKGAAARNRPTPIAAHSWERQWMRRPDGGWILDYPPPPSGLIYAFGGASRKRDEIIQLPQALQVSGSTQKWWQQMCDIMLPAIEHQLSCKIKPCRVIYGDVTSNGRRVLGEFDPRPTGLDIIRLSPQPDMWDMLDTLCHELVHGALRGHRGLAHGEEFVRACEAVGLTVVHLGDDKASTQPTPKFRAWVQPLLDQMLTASDNLSGGRRYAA